VLKQGTSAPNTFKDWGKYGEQFNLTEFLIDLPMDVKFEIWHIAWAQVFHKKWENAAKNLKNLYDRLFTSPKNA